MKYRVVETSQGKVAVDESTEIPKQGDWVLDNNCPAIFGHDFGAVHTKEEIIKLPRIVASINHSIDKDVPMVVVDAYDIEKDWGNLAILKMICETSGIGNSYFKEKERLKAKYSVKQKGCYSKENMLEAYRKGEQSRYSKIGEAVLESRFIQSLDYEYIELESDYTVFKSCCKSKEDCHCNRIKTDRVDGQLMAYLKTK